MPDAPATSPPPVTPRPPTNQVNGHVPGVPTGAPGGAFPPPSNRPVDWARWVPEVRLLEGPRIACSPVIVGLAFVGLLVAVGGDVLVCGLAGGVNRAARWPWEEVAGGVFTLNNPAFAALLAPVRPAAMGVYDASADAGWRTALAGLARVFWAVVVWAFFGTAIARTAAVRFASGASGSPVKAVKLAAAKWVSGVGGPLLPAAGVAALASGLAVVGWVGEIPAAGGWVVALLWGPALAAGLAAAALVGLAAVGWPLMLSALAVEGTDALDAFSRAFSYVLGRPLRVILHAAVGLLVGAVAVTAAAYAATAAAAFTAGLVDPDDAPPAADVVRGLWAAAWFALPAAYAAGLFWTTATVSYFLLRYADDAVGCDEIHTPADPPAPAVENEEAGDEVPRVGVAASSVPTVERSHRPTVGD